MKISVIGLGYIGLPTATMLATYGANVIGIDVRQHVVDTVNEGRIHIVEPDLDALVHAAVTERRLRASLAPEPADAFLIAVPTPFKDDHNPDVSYIEAAAKAIAPVLKQGDVVILESTSPVGTTENMVEWMCQLRPDLRFPRQGTDENFDVSIAYCPERVLPGQVVRELVENDRIIGGITSICTKRAAEVYKIFVKGELLATDARTAEMSKLTENAFRDVNIAFANELSLVCDKLSINVWELIELANHHPRVNILKPGCGVGGHCIAVDPWFIVDKAPDEARLIRTAREINDGKPHWVIDKVTSAVAALGAEGSSRSSVRVAVLGLAFKPDIDDLRESPALSIAKHLRKALPNEMLVVEPNIHELPQSLEGAQLTDLQQALAMADIVVVLVAHRSFKEARTQLQNVSHMIDATGIVDGR